jgi:dTDP-glucose pyrophosphorylase/CBS domain-containing protein
MRTQLDAFCIAEDASLRDAINAIDRGRARIALVLDGDGRLVGTLTDGDIRRCLLQGVDLDTPASGGVQRKFHAAKGAVVPAQALVLLRRHSIDQLPVIDADGRLLGLFLLDDLLDEPAAGLSNPVVLMAGGRGTRLRPLTDRCPKPMLQVAGKPILESILEQCIDSGLQEFYMAVNHLKEQIRNHFEDGSQWGVRIQYLEETMPLGTAGALQLLPDEARRDSPLLVMNGDVLTRLNLANLIEFHVSHGAAATMCVRTHDVVIPFGVVEAEGVDLLGFREKPTFRHQVNAGIYVLQPELLDHIPLGGVMDMPSLLLAARAAAQRVAVCPIHEYWCDIGRPETLQQAHEDWSRIEELS